MSTWKLAYTEDGEEIKVGDRIMHEGKSLKIHSIMPPHKPDSSGKIVMGEFGPVYYAHVFNLKFFKTEDSGSD